MRLGGQQHAPTSLPLGNGHVPIIYKAGCAPGPFSTVAENLGPTETRSTDRLVRSKSLKRLRYPRPCYTAVVVAVVVVVVVVVLLFLLW